MRFAYVICFLLAIVFSSCDRNRVFEENKSVDNNSWEVSNRLKFTVTIEDTSASYNMYINVRNAGWYPFSNLFVFIHSKLPDGTQGKDTAECPLADKDGRWLGDGLGDIWDNKILLKKNFKFTQTGEYVFELEQGMRVNPLPGIADAGIRIEKIGVK